MGWGVREFGSSADGEFMSSGVKEMRVREIGSLGDGEFVSSGVKEMGSS